MARPKLERAVFQTVRFFCWEDRGFLVRRTSIGTLIERERYC